MASQPHLPQRAGSRPSTSTEIPHRQLDQQPDDSRCVDAILAEALTWPAVLGGPSSISVDGARALTLDESTAPGPIHSALTLDPRDPVASRIESVIDDLDATIVEIRSTIFNMHHESDKDRPTLLR